MDRGEAENRSKNLEKGIRELLSDEAGEGLAIRSFAVSLSAPFWFGLFFPLIKQTRSPETKKTVSHDRLFVVNS
jgi:hypothetical protein